MDHNLVASMNDLCQLIKICARYQVLEAEINGLRLVFGPRDKSAKSKILNSAQTKLVEQESQKISDEANKNDRLDRVSEDLEELKLTDPLAYEQLLGGELIGEGGSEA